MERTIMDFPFSLLALDMVIMGFIALREIFRFFGAIPFLKIKKTRMQ